MKLKLNFIYVIVLCSMIHLYSGMAEKFLGCFRFSMTNDSGSFTPEFKLIAGLASILPTIMGVSTILWNKKQLEKQYDERDLEKFWLEEKQCLKSKILLDPKTGQKKIQWENRNKAEFFLNNICGMKKFNKKNTYYVDNLYGFAPRQTLVLLADGMLYNKLKDYDELKDWEDYRFSNGYACKQCLYNGEKNKYIFQIFEGIYKDIIKDFKEKLGIDLPLWQDGFILNEALFMTELIDAMSNQKNEKLNNLEALDLCRSMLSLCPSPIRSIQYIAQNLDIISNIKNDINYFLNKTYQPYIIKKLQEDSKVEWINMVPFLGLFSSLEKPNSLLLAANVLSTLSIFCLSFAWLLCDSNKAESFNMLSIYLITFCISMLHAVHYKKF